jgi:DNA-binding response OmpR family regulator
MGESQKMGHINNNQNRKRKILIVDDELDITFSLKLFLEENGFEVYTSNKPSSVLSDYRAGLYDLIILDIKMPEINGYELYERIKKMDNNVHVLFLTALSDFSNYIQESNKMPSMFDEENIIHKPVTNEELLKRIMTIVDLL